MSKVRALRGSRVTTQSNIGRKTEFDYPRGSFCPLFLVAPVAILFSGPCAIFLGTLAPPFFLVALVPLLFRAPCALLFSGPCATSF